MIFNNAMDDIRWCVNFFIKGECMLSDHGPLFGSDITLFSNDVQISLILQKNAVKLLQTIISVRF